MSNNPIQFRAWNGHKMCRVDSISFNAGGMIWHGPGEFGWGWIDETFEGWTPDNPKPEVVYPVMRWTGLHDKEGTKIWEGDIVRVSYPGYVIAMHVEYLAENLCWTLRNRVKGSAYRWDMFLIDDPETPKDNTVQTNARTGKVSTHRLEVIGNIYSNPDLLKS